MLLRRFLVVQMLMLWQGGFLFYASFVVPTGTEVLGNSFEQGRITRHVSMSMNWVGLVALAVFAWDILRCRSARAPGLCLWGSWLVMALGLAALFAIHPRLLELVDFSTSTFEDRGRFRFWHRTYLWICTFQWLAGLIYTVATLTAWRQLDRAQRDAINDAR